MNYSTAVFLINDFVRAVSVTYESEDNAKRTLCKTLDKTIKVGDYVVVPTETRHKMTVCKVVEVDSSVDFDSTVQINWIVGKIDRISHQELLDQEATAIEAIRAAELHKKRNDLRDAMLGAHLDTIKALPMASFNKTEASAAAAA